jgi:hypothetical protein
MHRLQPCISHRRAETPGRPKGTTTPSLRDRLNTKPVTRCHAAFEGLVRKVGTATLAVRVTGDRRATFGNGLFGTASRVVSVEVLDHREARR